jgi:hypothetical protein
VGIGSTMPLRATRAVLEVKAMAGRSRPARHSARGFRTVSPGFSTRRAFRCSRDASFAETDVKPSALVVILNKTLAADCSATATRSAARHLDGRGAEVHRDGRRVAHGGGRRRRHEGRRPRCGTARRDVPADEAGSDVRRRARDPSERDPAALARAATRIVRRIVPNDPIENVLTIGQIKDQSVAPRRLNACSCRRSGCWR